MKKYILIANDAPETGVSLLSALLAHYLESRQIKFTHVHTTEDDPGDAERVFYDISESRDEEELLSILNDAPVTIMDIASGEGDEFAQFLSQEHIAEQLEEIDVEVTLLAPTNGTEASLYSVIEIADHLHELADIVVAHNDGLAEGGVKAYWKGSHAQETMAHLQALQLHIPNLFEAGDDSLEELAAALAEGIAPDLDEHATAFLEQNLQLCFQPIDELLIGTIPDSPYIVRPGERMPNLKNLRKAI